MVNVSTDGPIFVHDAGSALFKAPSEDGIQYDVTENGERFAFNGIVEDKWTSISLVMNWRNFLRKD